MWTVREYIYIYSSPSLCLSLSIACPIRLRFIIVRDGHSVILLPVQLGPSGKDKVAILFTLWMGQHWQPWQQQLLTQLLCYCSCCCRCYCCWRFHWQIYLLTFEFIKPEYLVRQAGSSKAFTRSVGFPTPKVAWRINHSALDCSTLTAIAAILFGGGDSISLAHATSCCQHPNPNYTCTLSLSLSESCWGRQKVVLKLSKILLFAAA